MSRLAAGLMATTDSVGSGFDSDGLAAARIAHHIVDFVVAGPGAFGAGHVLALNEDTEGVVFRRKGAIGLQLLANGDVQFAAGSIVGRDDQSVFGRLDVAFGDGADALFAVGNFLHAALLLERVERGGDLARCQHFDGGFQRRVFLANDLVELGRAHSGFLQLLERAARFDALMLASVADQKHAVIGAEPRKELAHLVRAGKAGFVNHEKSFPLGIVISVLPTREKTLQCSGVDTGLLQLFRGARGRGEAFDLIALRFRRAADDGERGGLARAGKTLDSLDAVGRAEHIFDHALLRVVEMFMPVGNGDGLRARKNWLDLIFPLAHPMKNFLFGGDGFGGGELTARNALLPLDDLEFPGRQSGVKMGAHLVMGDLAHAAP